MIAALRVTSRVATLWTFIAIILVSNVMATAAASPRIVYASPGGGMRLHDGRVVETLSLRQAVKSVLTNHTDTVIQLVAGFYDLTGLEPIEISRHPQDRIPYGSIIVRGLASGTVIDGGRPLTRVHTEIHLTVDTPALQEYLRIPNLGMIDPEILANLPHKSAFSCFRIENQESIEIEHLTMQNCWLMAVFAIDSKYITLRDTRIIGSRNAFHAFGDKSHHFLLEGNHWTQDTSATRRMWREICWSTVKGYVSDGQRHEACPLEGENVGDYSHFNGALFGSWNIIGSVVVRNNYIENAFNGIRMVAPRGKQYRGKRNINVEIYGNKFHYIRDNPIEPEATATNWWIHHNEIFNAHSWFSFDGVWGGDWYIFGNVGWFDERPYFGCHNNPSCESCRADPECNLAWSGKVLKYSKDGPYPVKPAYVFNNSWYLRSPIAAGGTTRHLHHWNNAIQFCKPKHLDDGICQVTNKPGGSDVERCKSLTQAPPLRFFGSDFTLEEDGSNEFDYDLSNQCFPESLMANGQEVNGVVVKAGQRIFERSEKGDFRLLSRSPARDRGKIIKLSGRIKWSSDVEDGKPDIGAFEGQRPMRGPLYRHLDATDLYTERPRIVDVAWHPDPSNPTVDLVLRVTFSIEIENLQALDGSDIILRLGNETFFRSKACLTEDATLVCSFSSDSPLPPIETAMIMFPDGIRSVPQDGKREPMVLWASSYPKVSIWRKDE